MMKNLKSMLKLAIDQVSKGELNDKTSRFLANISNTLETDIYKDIKDSISTNLDRISQKQGLVAQALLEPLEKQLADATKVFLFDRDTFYTFVRAKKRAAKTLRKSPESHSAAIDSIIEHIRGALND
jgi:hypothetical protein